MIYLYDRCSYYQYNLLLYSSKVFYSKLFRGSNMCFMFLDFEIENLELLNDLECSHD